jgi:hypothetical protein
MQLFVGQRHQKILNDDIDASWNLLDDYHNNDDTLENKKKFCFF